MLKKSQIFIFDLIISFVILIVSLGMLTLYFIEIEDNSNIFHSGREVMSSITTTNINLLNDDEIKAMFRDGYIKNIQNTVAQQIAEFHYRGDDNMARNLTRVFVEDFFQGQININITLTDGSSELLLYSDINKPGLTLEDAATSTSISKTIFGFINKTDFYGPYNMTLLIWQ